MQHELENFIESSEPNRGFRAEPFLITPTSWLACNASFDPAPLATVAAGTVGYARLECGTNDMIGIQWNATADQTDGIALIFTLPGEFSSSQDELIFSILARKRDTGGASDNADLRLDGQLRHFASSDTTPTLETANQWTLPAMTTATTRASFTQRNFIYSGEGLSAGDRLMFTLFPQEAIGTALTVDLLETRVRFKQHAAFADRSARYSSISASTVW